MIIHPRVYVHRRLNQAQKAVLAGNYKLAVVITRWVLIHHREASRRPLFQTDFNQFMKDHVKTFGEWVGGNEGAAFCRTLTEKDRLRHPPKPERQGVAFTKDEDERSLDLLDAGEDAPGIAKVQRRGLAEIEARIKELRARNCDARA